MSVVMADVQVGVCIINNVHLYFNIRLWFSIIIIIIIIIVILIIIIIIIIIIINYYYY